MSSRAVFFEPLPHRLRRVLVLGPVPVRTRACVLLDSLFGRLIQHDRRTAEHCQRVCGYAQWLAAEMGLAREMRQQVGAAALLHDIGKLYMSPDVLNKPGPLTPAEFRQMQQHPLLGERLLRPLLPCGDVLAAVRWHHERLDGQGYPHRLAGPQIPLLARILAVADTFDAMTSTRSYRQALSWRQAHAILRRQTGSQFDPAVVACLARLTANPESAPFAAGLGRLPCADDIQVCIPAAAPCATRV